MTRSEHTLRLAVDFPTHSYKSSTASENSLLGFRKEKCTAVMVNLEVLATTAEMTQVEQLVYEVRDESNQSPVAYKGEVGSCLGSWS